MGRLELDHLAIVAPDLNAGTDWLEARLKVPLQDGGQHGRMGTHNRLLGLAPDLYLEVIAVDPAAPAPTHARWFALDDVVGPPRLANWIVAAEDLEAAIAAAADGVGHPMALARGDLRWRMAVPETGRLPFGGIFPALIEWEGTAHPAARLEDRGCRLRALEVRHPEIAEIKAGLSGFQDARVTFGAGEAGLRATFETPAGVVVI